MWAVYICPECGAHLLRTLGVVRATCNQCKSSSRVGGFIYPRLRSHSRDLLLHALEILKTDGVLAG